MNGRWRIGRLIVVGWLAGGIWACGASVPVWGPESAPEAADAAEVEDDEAVVAITDAESLAAALKADPSLRVVPGAAVDAPPPVAGLDPGTLVELPAAGVAADPEVLHAWLVDLGIAKVQIEQLLPTDPPDAPRFRGDGDPGILRLRLRRAPRR